MKKQKSSMNRKAEETDEYCAQGGVLSMGHRCVLEMGQTGEQIEFLGLIFDQEEGPNYD